MASTLVDILLQSGDLQLHQLESARGQQSFNGGRIEHILVDSRMIGERELVAAIARVTQFPEAKLDQFQPDGTALARLPDAFAWHTVCFPMEYDERARSLVVAVTDPTDIELADTIIRNCGCRLKAKIAGVQEIRRAIRRHYRGEYVPDAENAAEVPDFAPSDGEEEFKITDMSGNTVMTSLQTLKNQHDAQLAAKAAAGGGEARAPSRPAPPPPPIDDLTDSLFDIQALTPDERERIEKIAANVNKSGIILKALLELLEENGILWPGERDTL